MFSLIIGADTAAFAARELAQAGEVRERTEGHAVFNRTFSTYSVELDTFLLHGDEAPT